MKSSFQSKLLAGLFLAVITLSISAYPPAPSHTFFGMVRDEWGMPLELENAHVIFETPAGTAASAKILEDIEPGANYRLEVPLDSGTAYDLNQATALRPFTQYRLKVQVGNNTPYLPIQMLGGFAALGEPGKRTRLDLTLGVDSDRDGLPDAWERLLGNLAVIEPNGDADGDGLSNYLEYLAGTYAFDPASGSRQTYELKLLRLTNDVPVFEFMVLKGRAYTLQGSSTLTGWTDLPFRIPAFSAQLWPSYNAADTRVLEVEAPASGSTNKFYRLLIK